MRAAVTALCYEVPVPEDRRGRPLPDYAVRPSPRARRARLTYDPRRGLTVVIPQRFDRSRVAALVEANLPWIERTRARLGEAPRDPVVEGPFPRRLVLAALGETWELDYAPAPRPVRVRAVAPSQLRVFGGTVGPANEVHAALQAWLARRAAAALTPAVRSLATELGVGEKLVRVSIRAQRSRWGSCSARGTISLNRSLLFLPPELCRLVLLHEACHLRELSHSPRFWQLLESHEPDAGTLRRALRDAWRHVPAWAEPLR